MNSSLIQMYRLSIVTPKNTMVSSIGRMSSLKLFACPPNFGLGQPRIIHTAYPRQINEVPRIINTSKCVPGGRKVQNTSHATDVEHPAHIAQRTSILKLKKSTGSPLSRRSRLIYMNVSGIICMPLQKKTFTQ